MNSASGTSLALRKDPENDGLRMLVAETLVGKGGVRGGTQSRNIDAEGKVEGIEDRKEQEESDTILLADGVLERHRKTMEEVQASRGR